MMAEIPGPVRKKRDAWVAAIAVAGIAAALGLYIVRSPQAGGARMAIVRMTRSVGRLFGQKDASQRPIAAVIRDLEQGDEARRAQAIILLRTDRPDPAEFPQVFPYLIRALKDDSPMVREAAMIALPDLAGRFGRGEADVEGPITGLLDDPSPKVRAMAAGILRPLAAARHRDVPPLRLVACLDDASEQVRAAAAEALVEYGQGTALFLPVALRRLPTESPVAFGAFTHILWNLRFPTSTLPLLVETLSSDNALLCVSAATMINHMGRDAESARPAVMALLRRELATPHRRPDPRVMGTVDIVEQTCEALVQLSPEGEPLPGTVEILCEALKRPNAKQQHAAAWSLGYLGRLAAPAVPLLLSTYEAAPPNQDDPRGVIAEALAEITRGTPDEDRVIAALANAWKTAPQSQKWALARALHHLGPKAEQLVPEVRDRRLETTTTLIPRGGSPRSFLAQWSGR